MKGLGEYERIGRIRKDFCRHCSTLCEHCVGIADISHLNKIYRNIAMMYRYLDNLYIEEKLSMFIPKALARCHLSTPLNDPNALPEANLFSVVTGEIN